jgi:hypothetical protein
MRRAWTGGVLAGVMAAGAVSELGWMEGRWTGTHDGVQMEEHWTSPAGEALIGMHKDVLNGRMVSFEFLRVGRHEDGIAYFASPRSSPPTPFRLVEMGRQRVVFENKENDFPQRILYWLDPERRLHARIEGTHGGQALSEEWEWVKAR